MANPVKLGTLPDTPGPSASNREWSEWADAARTVIQQLKFAVQGLTGNPSIQLQPSTASGGSAPTALATAAPSDVDDATAVVGTSTKAAREDHVHSLGTAGDTNYVRRDGTVTVTGDLTWDAVDKGPVLVVNDGAADRTYRIELKWNAGVSRPMIELVEIV